MTVVVAGKRSYGAGKATLTLSNFSLTVAAASSNVTFNYDSTLGSVTVGGFAVTSGTTQEVPLEDGAALVATPNSGTTFLGWVDEADNSVLSTAASYTLKPAADITVKAVFIGADSAPHFGVGGATERTFKSGLLNLTSNTYYTVDNYTYIFDNLTDAAATAKSSSSKCIVLLNSGTLPAGEYTIPSGVTLLIPFDSSNTLYTTRVQSVEAANFKTPTAYRTLTMEDGAKLIVNGNMCLSAKQKHAAGGSPQNGGSPSGDVSFVRMQGNSSITINGGGALYAYGYITGSGSVTANAEATIYEMFQFMDFRGGTKSTGMQNGVFPLSQYYVQNIEVPLTLYAGATEYAFTTINMSGGDFGTEVQFIGSKDCMFNLTSGYATKRYDGEQDRLIIELYGTAELASISLKFGTTEISSAEYELPLSHNVTVKLMEGTATISQDLAMLPGSEIYIAEGTTCTLGSGNHIYIYDADAWTGNFVHIGNEKSAITTPPPYAPGRAGTAAVAIDIDASICVNGTVDLSAGYGYTTADGANIYSTKTGKVISKAGTETVTYQYDQYVTTYAEISITPVQLKNANGTEYSQTANGDQTVTYTYDAALGEWGGIADVVSNGTAVHHATMLAEAVAEYGTPADEYIKMVHDSAVGANIKKTGTVLDLNGKNITGVVTVPAAVSNGDGTVTHGLYGMDSSSDGYQNATGSITVSSGTVAPVTEFAGKNNIEGDSATLHRYLAVNTTGSVWEFHRFNISVTDYYLEVLSTGDARIGFGATFRGDSTVIENVSNMGFTVNGDSEMAGKTNLGTVADKYKLYYTIGTTVMGDNTAFAMLEFNNKDTQNSESRTVNFLTALKVYYAAAETPQDHKNMIDSFMTKAGLKWPTA